MNNFVIEASQSYKNFTNLPQEVLWILTLEMFVKFILTIRNLTLEKDAMSLKVDFKCKWLNSFLDI